MWRRDCVLMVLPWIKHVAASEPRGGLFALWFSVSVTTKTTGAFICDRKKKVRT